MSTPQSQQEPRDSAILAQTSAVDMPKNVAEVFAIAKVMAASGFYPDMTTAAKAATVMMLGIQFGIPPVQSLTAIHIVKGKPMLHYSAILSKVRQHPHYDYEIVESTATKAVVEFYRIKEGKMSPCGKSEFTAADAKRQGTQNMEKFPDTMLLARAVSNGVKRFCPDVLNGMPVYTPGEIEPEETYTDSPSKAKALMAELSAGSEAPQAVEPSEPEEYAPVHVVDPETGEVYAPDGPGLGL